jgi:hypothetical protein
MDICSIAVLVASTVGHLVDASIQTKDLKHIFKVTKKLIYHRLAVHSLLPQGPHSNVITVSLTW